MAMPDDMSEPEPLSTALAELPSLLLDTSRDPERRRRVDRIFWECAARGESVAALGQWACQHPSVFQELVFDARTFAARVRAARALHVLADGVRDETGLQMASALTSAVLNWFAHPEPMLWAVAGRALGRLSARVAIARDAIVGWSRSAHTWQRRRIALTLGTRPPDLEVWVEDEVAQILADREDGFRVAALGLAGPWLARDRPNVWAELLERAAGGEAELGWSVAQALAMLARGRGSQGLSESERTTARMLLATSTGFASRSSEEATRHFETALHSAQALAIGAATLPAVALLDQAIAGRFRAVGSVGTLLPLASIISSLESSDETGRGAAQFALRSMTRATCAELEDLAGGRHLPDVGELWETVENRLANDIHEFGQRATLVACLGDLADHGDHGASAARALHALARSRWAREAVVLAPEARGRAVALRRFRKPILDLLRRCAPTPDHQSQLPAAAAWWTISCGDAALMPLPSAPACIALQDAMRAATFGESPRVWGSAVLNLP